MQALLKKQKADREKAARRLELRRGYAQAGRERDRARRLAESGLDDLPDSIAAAIEELPATPEPQPEPVQPDASVEDLVARLVAIKERIFRLRALFAVSLSADCAIEADKYLAIFQGLAAELRSKDPQALDKIVVGHEAMLSSPPIHVRQAIPIETQRLVELRWEVMQSPARRAPKRPTTGDGLDWLVS
jgi:hypothetical protein